MSERNIPSTNKPSEQTPKEPPRTPSPSPAPIPRPLPLQGEIATEADHHENQQNT